MDVRSEKWISHFMRMAQKRKSRTMGDVSMPNSEPIKQVTPQQQTYEQAVANIKEEKEQVKQQPCMHFKPRVGKQLPDKPKKTQIRKVNKVPRKPAEKKAINSKKKLERIINNTVFAPK